MSCKYNRRFTMYLPSRNSNFFDDFFNSDFWGRDNLSSKAPLMRTDIKEVGDNYELHIELPGFEKKDISASLKNGYLTVSANHESKEEKKDEKGGYIRRERRFGACSRSFYVGDNLTEEDIKGSYENGVLKLSLPKNKEKLPQEKKLIAIE